MREGPIVEVIERMIGKGFSVSIYDKNVKLSNLIGANRAFIEKEIPHIGRLIRETVDKVVQDSEVIVVSQKNEGLSELPGMIKEQIVVDLIGAIKSPASVNGQYYRFC